MKIPVHVGLFGHIDHGKTALAARLSEKVSTAGLDKHPQSKDRGITIDIGFTAFDLHEYLVVLVDAPGHADLISNAVAAATIIDVAILVIAANEGPMVQTGEHILVLDSFGVNLIIALNKVDLVNKEELERVTNRIRSVLKNTRFEGVKIVPISAKMNQGIEELKEALYSILKVPVRKTEGPFKMPIDHAFPIKGAGTVLTGTIYRGKISVGDTIEIVPLGLNGKIKNIQIFKENLQTAAAGDRVGISVPGLDSQKIYRGCYASTPGTLMKTNKIAIKAHFSELFKGILNPKMQVHVTAGMPTVPGVIYPYELNGSDAVLLDEVHPGENFFAFIVLNEYVAVETGDPIILARLDLPPNTLRIVGSGTIINPAPGEIVLSRKHQKTGTVRVPVHKRGSVVDGLVQSKEGGEKMIGEKVVTETGIEGRVVSTFGTKSALIIEFSTPPVENEKVYLKRLRKYSV
jgi:selenocysteine-specific elongation factor